MPVPCPRGESATPHSGLTVVMSVSASVRLDQDVRSVDTRIEKTHGWNVGPWPFGSFSQVLCHRSLLVTIHIIEKERRAVARPAKLDN